MAIIISFEYFVILRAFTFIVSGKFNFHDDVEQDYKLDVVIELTKAC